MNIPLVLLIAYSLGLTLLGLWVGRLVRGSGDFFVAGRRLSAPLLFATFLAANIGAGTTVGAAGLAYRDGVSAWWWNGSAGLGSIVLAVWIGPRVWRLAAEHDFYTAGDLLEFRYGPVVRGVVASFIWLGTLSILAGQLIAGAAVLEVVAGISRPAGALIGAAAMTIYFAAGGLLSSAWVNAVQLVVLLAGFALAVPIVSASVGGPGAIAATPDLHAGYWNVFYSGGPDSGWAQLTFLLPAFMVSPGLLQKAYGASTERAVRVGVGLQGIALLLFSFMPVFFGIAARAAHPGIASQNLVLPTLFLHDLPVWAGALGLAAIFSAEVSTCDAILFMLSTSLSKDLYKRFVNPQADDRRVLLVARLASVVGGALGVLLAIRLATIVDALRIFYSLLGVSLFVPVVGGLLSKRAGSAEALASIAAGIGTLLVAQFGLPGRGFSILDPDQAGRLRAMGLLNPSLLGLCAAAAAFVLVGLRPYGRSPALHAGGSDPESSRPGNAPGRH